MGGEWWLKWLRAQMHETVCEVWQRQEGTLSQVEEQARFEYPVTGFNTWIVCFNDHGHNTIELASEGVTKSGPINGRFRLAHVDDLTIAGLDATLHAIMMATNLLIDRFPDLRFNMDHAFDGK